MKAVKAELSQSRLRSNVESSSLVAKSQAIDKLKVELQESKNECKILKSKLESAVLNSSVVDQDRNILVSNLARKDEELDRLNGRDIVLYSQVFFSIFLIFSYHDLAFVLDLYVSSNRV